MNTSDKQRLLKTALISALTAYLVMLGMSLGTLYYRHSLIMQLSQSVADLHDQVRDLKTQIDKLEKDENGP